MPPTAYRGNNTGLGFRLRAVLHVPPLGVAARRHRSRDPAACGPMQHDVARTSRPADIHDVAVRVPAQPIEVAVVVAIELDDTRTRIDRCASGHDRSPPCTASPVSTLSADCAYSWSSRSPLSVPGGGEESKANRTCNRSQGTTHADSGRCLAARALLAFGQPSPQAVSALRVTIANACALRAPMPL